MKPRRLLLPILLATLPLASAHAAPSDVQGASAKPTQSTKSTQKAGQEEVPRGATRREIEMGDKAQAELEKSPKLHLLDPKSSPTAKALIDKLNEMAHELGSRSARPEIAYEVKVIDDTDLNAFTIPNGKIYMYRGLLDFAASDDEIAGVLSHEIGHNAKMHAVRGAAKSKKLSLAAMAAMAAMLLGRGGADVGQFSQYLLMGIMNGYTENYEKEADTAAIDQMKGTRWNPSALVTFMRRLEQAEKSRPEFEPGIFRTHPPSEARAEAAIAQMKSEGLEFSPRDVQGARRAQSIASADRVRVLFGSDVLIELAATPATLPAVQARANAIAARVNDLLKDNLKLHEISLSSDAASATILARGLPLAQITAADATLGKGTPLEVATRARDNFRKLFWRETIRGAL
jgi:predicted Zn-dependent protease